LDRPEGEPAPPAATPYSAFAAQQRRMLASSTGKRLVDYWSRQLRDLHLPALPMSRATPGAARHTELVQHTLGPETVTALDAVARRERSTLFVALLTAYYQVLHQVSGSNDLTVASLFANRAPDYRETVGFLANMVLLRTRLWPDADVAHQLRAAHATVMEAFLHQAMPLHLLPITLADKTRRPDDVVFQMMPDPVYRTRAGGLDLEVLVPQEVPTRFELELVAVPTGDTVRILLYYNADRFSAGFVRNVLDRYVEICTALSGYAVAGRRGRSA
jgi:non-ribosomal peptide synthetase component F